MLRDNSHIGARSRSSNPLTKTCYICGRDFGSKSIIIHEPQCILKWEREQAKLPKAQRRPLPTKPEIIINKEGKIDIEKTNEKAREVSQANLEQCKWCNRTFEADRLAVHNRSCTQDRPAKKVPK
uniref:Zinc finger protein 474 n=1 Tax=Rhabditophanes sp. KR3021 TaxID=114890 RepID=A0AC35TSF7_9BILA